MTEYGRIHTDGSRSGGQPLHSDVERVARALAQADGIEICSDATYALSSYGHKAQAALAAMRQPTQSKVAAACTDRIGGAGVVPHGVVGVATQSDAEITEADCNVAEYIAGDRARDLDYQVVAYHRKWSVLEERAKIVAWLRSEQISTEKLRDEMNRHTAGWRFADEHASALEQSAAAIERGEHLQGSI